MKGFLYIENNQVVINPELKPEEHEYAPVLCFTIGPVDTLQFNIAVREWESQLVKVENVKQRRNHWVLTNIGTYPWWIEIVPGQPCEYEGKQVTKLL